MPLANCHLADCLWADWHSIMPIVYIHIKPVHKFYKYYILIQFIKRFYFVYPYTAGNLYYKTLWICNFLEMNRFCSKLVTLLLPVTFIGLVNTQPYYSICTLQIRYVFLYSGLGCGFSLECNFRKYLLLSKPSVYAGLSLLSCGRLRFS